MIFKHVSRFQRHYYVTSNALSSIVPKCHLTKRRKIERESNEEQGRKSTIKLPSLSESKRVLKNIAKLSMFIFARRKHTDDSKPERTDEIPMVLTYYRFQGTSFLEAESSPASRKANQTEDSGLLIEPLNVLDSIQLIIFHLRIK